MRKIFIVLNILTVVAITAQAPQKMSFQAVIRSASNNLITSATVGIKISIVQTTPTGTVVYSERHTPSTNINGLASIEIGTGTVLSGTFATINWGLGPYFIKNEVDPTGGTTYTISNTSQIMSTPYALYAAKSGDGWSMLGNTGTTSSNFIGTTDAQALVFKINNQFAGTIDSSKNITFWGYKAGASNIGNTANTAIGYKALNKDSTGNENTAIGHMSQSATTVGFRNSSLGNNSLLSNTTGYNNVALGNFAMNSNTTGNDNVAVGRNTLFTNDIGQYNTVVGSSSMFQNTTGSANTAIGNNALSNNTIGIGNTAIGTNTLQNNTTGSFNTALGFGAEVSANNLNNATVIGKNAKVAISNAVILGDSTSGIKVGIGTGSPTHNLHLKGTLKIVDGTQGIGKVLTSDASGVANWQSIVTIPDTWGTQVAQTNVSLSGNGSTANPLGIAPQGATSGQVLKWNGAAWLPSTDGGADNWGTQTVNTSTRLIGNGTVGTPLDIAQQGAITGQVLKWNGIAWVPTSDNQGWSLTGNSVLSTDFIGTTNNQALRLKFNSINAGIIDIDNVALGYKSFNSNSSGSKNISIGAHSQFSSTTTSNNIGIGDSTLFANSGTDNLAIGTKCLKKNLTGFRNIGIGNNSFSNSVTAVDGIAIGLNAMMSNKSGLENIIVGNYAFSNDTSGIRNTIVGSYAALNCKDCNDNVVMGNGALRNSINTESCVAIGNNTLKDHKYNNVSVAIGNNALSSDTNGVSLVAVGGNALYLAKGGTENTALGMNSYATTSTFFNATALGASANVTANNQVRIGSSSVGSIGGQVGWTTLSDGRFKSNIVENIPGLSFINLLRPVSYTVDKQKQFQYVFSNIMSKLKEDTSRNAKEMMEQISKLAAHDATIYTGFIAQDVETAAKKLNFQFSGVDAPKNDNDYYGLRYAEFVVPLVKAVQELDEKNKFLEQQNVTLKNDLVNQQKQINELKTLFQSTLINKNE
jgi:trimeric autotransporter adhesin